MQLPATEMETLGEETLHDFGQENSEIPVVAQVRSRGQLIAKSGVRRDHTTEAVRY